MISEEGSSPAVQSQVATAQNCPSGAIRNRRKDDGAEESPPPVNLIQVRENGPLALRGALSIDGEAIDYRATLCRCGQSQNKPFCDGQHAAIGFQAGPTASTE